MTAAFLEAVRSLVQPCTFLLVAPIVLAVVVAGARWYAAGAAVGGAVVGGWALAGNWWFLGDAAVRAAGAGLVVAVAAVAVAARLPGRRRPLLVVPAVAAVAVLATAWWRPCVGDQLGTILTAAQTGVAGQLPGMTAYMLGTMLPVVALACLRRLVSVGPPMSELARGAAIAGSAILGVALLAGRHDDVVVALTRWTQG